MARIVHYGDSVQPFHILVVDDDDLAILNLQATLSRAGHVATVTSASSGREALALLRGGSLPEERLLVLTDVNMPGMSGIELMREIRRDPALTSLPIVILTASALAADRSAAFALQAAGYFVKPAGHTHFRDVAQWLYTYWGESSFGPRPEPHGA